LRIGIGCHIKAMDPLRGHKMEKVADQGPSFRFNFRHNYSMAVIFTTGGKGWY